MVNFIIRNDKLLSFLPLAGNGFVEIDRVADPNNEGKFTLKVKFDRSQVLTTGKEALKKFLLHQQVYKSTADITSAREFFGRYSEVNEKFLQIREVVIENIKPRYLENDSDVP